MTAVPLSQFQGQVKSAAGLRRPTLSRDLGEEALDARLQARHGILDAFGRLQNDLGATVNSQALANALGGQTEN